MAGVGQPDALPLHRLRVDGVVCLETGGALAATNIITVPGTFTLRTEFGFDGTLDNMIVGDMYHVVHHWQRIEDGATGVLPFAAPVPVPAALSHILSTSPVHTTAINVGGDLVVPLAAGFGFGTYRIFTHIHFEAPNNHTHAGFYDGLVIVVVA